MSAVDFTFSARRLFNSPVRGLIVCASLCCALQSSGAQAAGRVPGEPGWMPVVVARGELREQIEATPMEDRPYRPFHFYGNTVRRVHYHGTALPRVFVRPVLDTNSTARVNVVENARERRSSR